MTRTVLLDSGPLGLLTSPPDRRVWTMAIADLVNLIPPPRKPIDALGDWTVAEREFDIVFPSDFKELIARYGTGQFYGDLLVSNPLTQWGRNRIRDDLARWGELKEACEFTYVLHPEKPGLFPWGGDFYGDLYCWWTEGNPDSWPVAQLAHEEEETPHVVRVAITEFLVKYVENAYPMMLGGRPYSAEDRRFVPGCPWAK